MRKQTISNWRLISVLYDPDTQIEYADTILPFKYRMGISLFILSNWFTIGSSISTGTADSLILIQKVLYPFVTLSMIFTIPFDIINNTLITEFIDWKSNILTRFEVTR